MSALGSHGFPVPVAIENNRHAVLMSLVDAFPLVQVTSGFQLNDAPFFEDYENRRRCMGKI